MQAYAFTDVGRYRSINQDYIYSSTALWALWITCFLWQMGWEAIMQGNYASRLRWRPWWRFWEKVSG